MDQTQQSINETQRRQTVAAALCGAVIIAAILLILVFLLNCAAKLAQKGLARKYQ